MKFTEICYRLVAGRGKVQLSLAIAMQVTASALLFTSGGPLATSTGVIGLMLAGLDMYWLQKIIRRERKMLADMRRDRVTFFPGNPRQ